MYKVNKKVIITAFVLMLIMTVTVAILSFSLADENDDAAGTGVGDVEASTSVKTNIDRIIENATSTDADVDTVYHIVEIGSGSNPSKLQSMVEAGEDGKTIFQELVINGNRTIEAEMPDGKIDYTYYSSSQLMSMSDEQLDAALKVMTQADFIYVRNEPHSQYTPTNDLPEDVYSLLHTFAVGDYKPMMIDSPTETDKIEKNSTKTLGMLVSNIFEVYGSSRYTFGWTNTQGTEAFFNHRDDSMYLPMHGNDLRANWEIIDNGDGSTSSIAKILTIVEYGDDENSVTTLTDMIKADLGTPLEGATALDASGNEITLDDIYSVVPTSQLYVSAYNAREVKPTYVKFETASLDDVAGMDLSGYDMIILEADCGASSMITDDVYSTLAGIMYANQHLVYDRALISGSSDDTSDAEVNNDTNYEELFYVVATVKEVARYSNVLVTNQDQVNMFAAATVPGTMSPIVSIINSGSYRGIGGQGNSSNMYTVLEIQPCYPIDEQRALDIASVTPRAGNAASQYGAGNYYTDPDNVLDGVTLDEITDPYQEYYAWELSKAKIADVTGLPYDQINLVQMSTEEFICSHTTLADSYDMIYIGGNNSAIKDIQYFILGGYADGMTNYVGTDLADNALIPVYNMYYHNGDWYTLTTGPVQSGINAYTMSNLFGTVQLNGSYKTSVGLLNGNDLTMDKYEELIAYMQTGMPVVFSKQVSEAFEEAQEKGVNQTKIDPDSIMYDVLSYAKDLADKGTSNILWGFDNTSTVRKENENNKYGQNTVYGYATVFADDVTVDCIDGGSPVEGDGGRLSTLIKTSHERPKLTLTSMPAVYDQNNDDTVIQDGILKFKYEIDGSASSYTINLYIDDDGNSKFTEDEIFQTVSASSNGTYQYELSSAFFGPVYWKFEVVDNDSKCVSSYSAVSKVANRTGQEKQLVQVLQIMPESGEGAEGENTLYLCTECQQAYERLEGNAWSNAKRGSYGALYGGNYEDSLNSFPGNVLSGDNPLGTHEHKFGIVKYDSTMVLDNGYIGADDWDDNLADLLSDEYDIKIDIVSVEEYEEMCQAVLEAYNFTDEYANSLVATYEAGKTDADFDDDYLDLTDTREKAVYITSQNYLEASGDAWQLYTFMREEEAGADSLALYGVSKTTKTAAEEFEAALQEMINGMTDTYAKDILGYESAAEAISELQRLIDTDKYYEYFSTSARYNDYSARILGESIVPIYIEWREAKNKELEAYNDYIENLRMSSVTAVKDSYGNERLIWDVKNTYSTVVIGASDSFAGEDISDIGTEPLVEYIDNDGTVLMFHDTTTYSADSGAINMTTDLLSKIGMNSRHLKLDDTSYDAAISLDGLNFVAPINTTSASTSVTLQQVNEVISGDIQFSVSVDGSTLVNYGDMNLTNEETLVDVTEKAQLKDMSYLIAPEVKFTVNNYEVNGYDTEIITSGEATPGYSTVKVKVNNFDKSAGVAGKNVTVTLHNGMGTFTGTTDADGMVTFEIPNARFKTYSMSTTSEPATEGSTSRVLNVTVLDADGNPISGKGVSIKASNHSASATTSADGAVMFDLPDAAFTTYSEDNFYLPYVVENGYSSDEYFLTSLSKFENDPDSAWTTRYNQLKKSGVGSDKYLTAIGLTESLAVGWSNGGSNDGGLMYRYADVSWADMAFWAMAASQTGTMVNYGSDRATQNNTGIVTNYPMKISASLNVSGTHNQMFSLDIEDEDLTVWYTLAGSSQPTKTGSIYAATPNDGADNYFIYSYNNVYYCGAGHTKVTGAGKDNNDERMLYINVICNSVRKSAKMPTIKVYDYNQGEKLGEFIKVDADGTYYAKVDDMTATPLFAYKATTDDESEIRNVKIYYDLDYLTNQTSEFVNDSNHILIFESGYDPDNNVASGLLKQIDTNVALRGSTVDGVAQSQLQLKPEYFDPYNQEYTYIVIAVTDNENSTVYQRIKIMMTPYLHDLT